MPYVTEKRSAFRIKKNFGLIEPYRLVNERGLWYLAAQDDGVLKLRSISCKAGFISNASFQVSPKFNNKSKMQKVSGMAKTLRSSYFSFCNAAPWSASGIVTRAGNYSYFPIWDLLVISRIAHTEYIAFNEILDT
jgi:hypothetical protein